MHIEPITMTAFYILFFLLTPLVISFLSQKFKLINKIGTVLMCYVIGLILGHTSLFNETTYQLQDDIASASILLALPILLFDSNPRKWRKNAGVTIKSMLTAIVALAFVVAIGNQLFGSKIEEGWKIGGMLIGVYTGGTPNLASIKTALNVSNDVYIGVHTIDTALGAIYLFFLLTVGKVWFRKILPYKQSTDNDTINNATTLIDFKTWLLDFNYKTAALGLLISVIIAALSAGTGFLFSEAYQMTVIILMITTLGILTSLFKFSTQLKSAFPVGMYFINVFSLAVASRANIYEIAHLGSNLIYYVSFVLFATFALHLALSKLLRIDSDTMMITSTALICSPPFVPVIAGALKNKQLLLPGLTVGIIGYAIGNYLGVLFAYILK